MVESLLKEYPNVLTLRVRMPIVADLVYPRNFITKIIKYDKVSQSWSVGRLCCCPSGIPVGCRHSSCHCAGFISCCIYLCRLRLLTGGQHPQLNDSPAGAAALLH
jgi:hypothetical protein